MHRQITGLVDRQAGWAKPLGEKAQHLLGDVFATPSSWPLYNVYSVGDITIVLGVLVLLHGVCGSRLVPRRWRRVPVPAAA